MSPLPPRFDTLTDLHYFILQSHGYCINAPRHRDSGPRTHIAIIDSLYSVEEANYDGLRVENNHRYVDTMEDDTYNHGSEVFEIINYYGHGAVFSFYQVVDEEGGIAPGAFSDAIQQAIADGVDIINLSTGSWMPDCPGVCGFCTPAKAAIDEGIIVIAAAGNNPDDGDYERVNCPSRAGDVISVGGMVTECGSADQTSGEFPDGAYWVHTEENTEFPIYPQTKIYCGQRGCSPDLRCEQNQIDRPWEANVLPYGDKPDILAPFHILHPVNGDSAFIRSGTSFAAPIVTGTVADMICEIRANGGESPSPGGLREEMRDSAMPMDRGEQVKYDAMGTQIGLDPVT